MNRQLTTIFAGAEALLVVAIGIAIPLAPLTLLWGVQYGFAADWSIFWRASVDSWLIGHGVDVAISLDPVTAAALGVAGADAPFTITIAALGFAMLTVLLGVRAGRRVAETGYLLLGPVVSLVTFAAASALVAYSALHPFARPSLVQGTVLPTLVFALGLGIGLLAARRDLEGAVGPGRRVPANKGGRMPRAESPRSPELTVTIVASLRSGVAAAALIIAAASAVSTAALLLSYSRVISLYEALQTQVIGGVVVTLGQLAFVPNVVVWTASWLIGPGFAIGSGSTAGPLGSALGPIPAIPLFGALPQGELAFGFLGLLVPIVAGFLAGASIAPRVRGVLSGWYLVAVGPATGVVGGVILGLLAWASGGAAGPGRLAAVGPDPVAVGAVAALEIGIAASIGLFSALRLRARS